jgi:hypothetical protein
MVDPPQSISESGAKRWSVGLSKRWLGPFIRKECEHILIGAMLAVVMRAIEQAEALAGAGRKEHGRGVKAGAFRMQIFPGALHGPFLGIDGWPYPPTAREQPIQLAV